MIPATFIAEKAEREGRVFFLKDGDVYEEIEVVVPFIWMGLRREKRHREARQLGSAEVKWIQSLSKGGLSLLFTPIIKWDDQGKILTTMGVLPVEVQLPEKAVEIPDPAFLEAWEEWGGMAAVRSTGGPLFLSEAKAIMATYLQELRNVGLID